MRLIDADALRKNFEDLEIVRHEWMTPSRGEIQGLDVAICVLADAPTIDAVPVVRCRECVHWATGTNEEESWEYCTLLDHEIDGDRFCAYGERKDGAE